MFEYENHNHSSIKLKKLNKLERNEVNDMSLLKMITDEEVYQVKNLIFLD
jgi:hypothetical protein